MSSYLPNHATLTFTHHPTPLSLFPRAPHPPTTLPSLCRASTPPCTLNPLLFNGHLQTLWTATTATDIPIHYKRHVFSATDPAFAGTFAVDFVVPPYAAPVDAALPPRTTFYTEDEYEALGGTDDTPMVVVLHGLSGGSHESYLRAVLQPLVAAGWAACVVNARGCAMSAITTGVLYNARATWDVRQVVGWCRARWPLRELFGVGFSMGANILVNVRRLCSFLWSVQTMWFPFFYMCRDGSDAGVGPVVSGRGGGGVFVEGGGGVLEPVELGGGELGATADVDWEGGVFTSLGNEPEEFV
ncbi:hypothetical protein MMC11_003863 [Xylographa trunciseda]|nr:hypothetical protein [Xylographa trunciseda]